jgi:hypothetical protein
MSDHYTWHILGKGWELWTVLRSTYRRVAISFKIVTDKAVGLDFGWNGRYQVRS